MSLAVEDQLAADAGSASADAAASGRARERSSRSDVTFVGALPPPLTGMTAITEVVIEALEERTEVRKFNWSRGVWLTGWRWKLARLWGATKSLFGLALHGRARGAKLYYAVSSGWGLYCDIAIATLSRLLGYRLVLHHHVYTYINRRDWRVAVLDKLVGRSGAHAVYCELMREDFLRRYKSHAKFLMIPPTIVSQQLEDVPPEPRTAFTLGFLSNLSFAKGVGDAIATFERLASQGHDVRLVLAGPCIGKKVEAAIVAALAKWPGRIEYLGPVYGREKAQFYANLDVFLFPTRHRHESWGIVLTEAMSRGCPVIARMPGCVPWIVQNGSGSLVPDNADFVPQAATVIVDWMAHPQQHAAAREAARRRSVELHEQAERELPEFVDDVLALGSEPAVQVTFVGALPPPVTGMTAMTEVIVEAIERHAQVRRFNWSRGKPLSGVRWKLARAWGAFKSLFGLLAAGRARGAILYYAVSRRGGLYVDLAIASLARLLGYRLVMHHHSYTYIDQYDWRAALLNRLTHTHAVHCELMRQDFLRQYHSRAEFLYVPPTIVAQQLEVLPSPRRQAFTLGHLGFIMLEKGIDETIATFERLAEQGHDVRLVIAGPCTGRRELRLLEETLARWGNRVEYRGPVYDHAKAQFFADIDVFLFPTRYKTESWGIVLTESLAAGRPAIARSRGCVPWIIRDGCGLVVDPQADFVSSAAALIASWITHPEIYRSACQAARHRSAELQADADRELPEFVSRVLGRGPDAPRPERSAQGLFSRVSPAMGSKHA